MRTFNVKKETKTLEEKYQEAKDYEFNEQFRKFVRSFSDEQGHEFIINEDDLKDFLDSFEFPSKDEWVAEKLGDMIDDYGDAKYEESKDEE